MPLTAQQEELCSQNTTDFSDLKAVTVNCSLKRNPDESHTRLLISVAEEIMRKSGVSVESIHAMAHQIVPGIYPDMTEYGWDRDDWPKLWPVIEGADILILATPIWLGEESSVCRILIERLYAMSGMLNAKGQ
ncbi:MAG: NAD(P)H-dependent oxidoreductase, partial [Methyloceanibacter sp.]